MSNRISRIPARTVATAGGRDYLAAVTLMSVTLTESAWLACDHKALAGATVLRAVTGPTTVHYCSTACRARTIGGAL